METNSPATSYTSFAGVERITTGSLKSILLKTKSRVDDGERESILIFEDLTGRQVDFDFRGKPDDVLFRALASQHSIRDEIVPHVGPGRPKLGVISREISLMPRHWEWLEEQPNGISAAIRRLVDDARKREPEKQVTQLRMTAASRVMTALGGDRSGYEEAVRALFARDKKLFDAYTHGWPVDIRRYLKKLTVDVWVDSTS